MMERVPGVERLGVFLGESPDIVLVGKWGSGFEVSDLKGHIESDQRGYKNRCDHW